MAETLQVAHIPIGLDGFNGSNNLSQMQITELSDATNISYEQNLIQKEAGALKLNSSVQESGADIIAGIYWEPTAAAQYDVIYVSGKLKRDTAGDGSFSTTLRTGMTAQTIGQFIEAGNESGTDNRKLFFVDGVNSVEYVDGTGATTTALDNASPDWTGTNQPITGAVHEDRLWLAGNANDPHRVYYSQIDNHADFTSSTSGQLTVFPGEAGAIKGIVSFKGFLIVFKQYGVYYINTTDAVLANWKVGRVSRHIGCLSPMAMDVVDDDILFIDQVGMLRALSTLNEFGSFGTKTLSDEHDMNRWIQSHISYAYIHLARLHYFPGKREVHAAIPINAATANNIRIIMDFSEGRMRYRLVDRDDCYSMWERRPSAVPEMAFGDGSGYVYRLYQETRTKDGAYVARFETAPTDFSDQDPQFGTRNKHGHYLEMSFEAASAGVLNVDIIWDNVVYQTVEFTLEGIGAALGSFELGVSKLSGSSSLKNIRKRIVGQGRRFALAGKHTGDEQNFKLAEAFLGFKMADHRIQRGE